LIYTLIKSLFYIKVLRFSRLLGFGRVTSLPKIWKGTRKRKKSKLSESTNDAPRTDSTFGLTSVKNSSGGLQAIPEETLSARLNSIDETNGEDVFKLFDQEFCANKTDTSAKAENKDTNEKSKVNLNVEKEINLEAEKKNEEHAKLDATEQTDQDEYEHETDDEVSHRFIFSYFSKH